MPIAITRLEQCQVAKLHQCVRESDYDQIVRLVEGGVPHLINYNEPRSGDTALNIAAKANDVKMVEFLMDVKIGAHPDVMDFAGQTALMVAAKYGHTDVLSSLLANHADIDTKDLNGQNVLFYCLAASTERHRECMRKCMDNAVDVNAVTNTGQSPLYEACKNALENESVCIDLLEKGAEANVIDKETGRSAVMEAAKSGSAAVVKELLTHDADVDVVDNEGLHAVHEAAKGGHLDVLSVLSAFGATFDQTDKLGNTPVHYAANGHAMCVKYLSQRGSNPKPKNMEGLFAKVLAKDLGHKDCVKECKKAEKSFGKKLTNNDAWAVALYDLCVVQKDQILEIFQQLDDDKTGKLPKEDFVEILSNNIGLPLEDDAIKKLVTAHTKEGGTCDYNDFLTGKKYVNKNYLMTAFVKKEKKGKKGKGGKKGKPKKPPFPICTMEEGDRTEGGNPPPMWLERYQHYTDFTRFDRDNPPRHPLQDDSAWYIQPPERTYVNIADSVRQADYNTLANAFLRGYHVDTRDRYFKTPLMVACSQGNLDLAKFLLHSGADINAKDNFKWTPLHFACHAGVHDLVEALVEAGADLNSVSMNGGTPLNRAIESSRLEVVEFMIQAGAKVQTENKKGWNLVDCAVQWSDPRVYDCVRVKLDSLPPPKDDKKKGAAKKSAGKKNAKSPKPFVEETPMAAPESGRRASILRAASALAKTLEQREDITYRPLHVWTKLPTTSEMIEERENRRVRFGWEVDFPDYKSSFNSNVDKRCDVQGGIEA